MGRNLASRRWSIPSAIALMTAVAPSPSEAMSLRTVAYAAKKQLDACSAAALKRGEAVTISIASFTVPKPLRNYLPHKPHRWFVHLEVYPYDRKASATLKCATAAMSDQSQIYDFRVVKDPPKDGGIVEILNLTFGAKESVQGLP